MTMTLVQRFVTEVERQYDEQPPGWAAAAAQRSLADYAVCAAAGWSVLDTRWAEGCPGDVHVIGLPRTLAASDAAAASAASAHALDRDDLHWPSVAHIGGVIWPVVLALGTETGAAGAAAIRAAAVGYEVTARLALALGAAHRRTWHVTTTAGTVGAATAGVLVAGGDVGAAVAAAGHAASVTGGLIQTLLERSGSRLFHRAHAARTAVAAARAGLQGLPSTREILEAPRGLFAATAPEADPADVLTRMAEGWAIERLTLRPYAASGFTHSAIDAALDLAPVDPSGVLGVRITASPACLALAAEPRPTDRASAWWSVQHAVAVSLVSGDPGALETGALDDRPEVRLLLGRMELRANEDPAALGATVEVRHAAGTRVATAAVPRGHPSRPLDDRQLRRKWTAMLPGLDEAGVIRLRSLANGVGSRPLPETTHGLAALLTGRSDPPRGR